MNDKEPTTLSTRETYKSKRLTVEERLLRFSDNHETTYVVVVSVPAVAVIAMPTPKSIILVRQFRPAAGRFCWEVPAGAIDRGESPEAAAIRELREETGYVAERMESIGGIFPSPGYSSEMIHICVARGSLTATGVQALDDDERVEFAAVPLRDALDWTRDGRIVDGKTNAALLHILNGLS